MFKKNKIGRSKQMELSKMVLIAFLVIAVGLIVLMVAKRKATVATPTVVVARNFDLSGYGNSYKAQYYN